MRYTLGIASIELEPEGLPEELWLQDFVEKRRNSDKDMLIEPKDNNGFMKIDGIPSTNVRKVRICPPA